MGSNLVGSWDGRQLFGVGALVLAILEAEGVAEELVIASAEFSISGAWAFSGELLDLDKTGSLAVMADFTATAVESVKSGFWLGVAALFWRGINLAVTITARMATQTVIIPLLIRNSFLLNWDLLRISFKAACCSAGEKLAWGVGRLTSVGSSQRENLMSGRMARILSWGI